MSSACKKKIGNDNRAPNKSLTLKSQKYGTPYIQIILPILKLLYLSSNELKICIIQLKPIFNWIEDRFSWIEGRYKWYGLIVGTIE